MVRKCLKMSMLVQKAVIHRVHKVRCHLLLEHSKVPNCSYLHKVIGYGSCSGKHKAGNRRERERVTQEECRLVKQDSHAPWYCHGMTSTKYTVVSCLKACQFASMCTQYNY